MVGWHEEIRVTESSQNDVSRQLKSSVKTFLFCSCRFLVSKKWIMMHKYKLTICSVLELFLYECVF